MAGPVLYSCPGGHEWDANPNRLPLTPVGPQICPVCHALGHPVPEATVRREVTVAAEAPRAHLPTPAGYQIIDTLGRGGMGVVYKARQVGLNRLVALKMVLSGAHAGPQELARFKAEAEAVAQLHHPNIVQIYEIGTLDEQPFFSLEYVDGGTLEQKAKGRALPPRQAAQFVEVIARAVDYAHRRGIIHRDLKPGNILLQEEQASPPPSDPAGPARQATASRADLNLSPPPAAPGVCQLLTAMVVPKITDFGLAKKLGQVSNITGSGATVGTPSYMAPEQAVGRLEAIGPATDVYALGVILYELLAGRLPFEADNPVSLLAKVVKDDPTSPRKHQAQLPNDLATIALKCLLKEPGQRYATAGDLADDLARFLQGEPIQARPLTAWERAVRAMKRNPAMTTLVTLLVLISAVSTVAVAANHLLVPLAIGLTVAGFLGILAQWRQAEVSRRLAEEQRQQAEAARREAEEQRKDAEAARTEAVNQARKAAAALQQAEAHLYTHRIALADREWLANNVARADEVLEACPTHLRHWEWYYLKRLCHTEHWRANAHPDYIRGLAFSPDGGQVATAGGFDLTARVWNAETGVVVHTLEGHAGCVRAVAYTPDGRRLITAGDDRTVRTHDAATGQPGPAFQGHADAIQALAVSPDGRRLATGGADRTVRVWDLTSRRELAQWPAATQAITQVAFSPDGSLIASGGQDRAVRLWDAALGEERRTLTGHTEPIAGLAFSTDGARLVTVAGNDVTIRLWDVAHGTEVLALRSPAAVWGAAFHPDGRHLATAGGDGVIRLWEAATGRPVFSLRGHGSAVAAVAFSADGRALASAGFDGSLRVWPALLPQEAVPFGQHPGLTALAFLPDSRRAVTAGGEVPVQVWDVATREQVAAIEGAGPVTAVAVRPDGRCLATAEADGAVQVWDAGSGRELLTFRGHTRGVVALAFSPTGDRVASASSDGTAKVWDPAGGQDLLTYRGNRGQLAGLAWRPDGRAVATLSVDVGRGPAEVKFWNPDTGVEAGSLPLPRQPDEAMLLAFSPDGQRLATASHGHTVLLWNARTRQELFTLRGHVRPIAAMAFSPDGARLVTASHDQTIKLWDTAGGEEILTLRGYGQETVLVAFSPDGQVLVTASKDGTLWRWERGTTWRERPRQAAAVGRQGRGSMPELLLPPPSRLFRATQVLPEPGD